MRQASIAVAALAALFLSACKDPPKVETSGPPSAFGGTWKWVCCDGKYSGTMQLNQTGADVTGTLAPSEETAALVLTSAALIAGAGPITRHVDGTLLAIDRQTTAGTLHIYLRGDSTGAALRGNFDGPHDPMAATDMLAHRVGHGPKNEP
jgi:hypothetical protein